MVGFSWLCIPPPIVSCPGGPINALSWKQVREISDRFAALNPYDRKTIPGSILKVEDDNYDPTTRNQRQLYCFAISAKRYALFLRDENGHPVLLRKDVNNKDKPMVRTWTRPPFKSDRP
jgi:hypothetical protein